MTEDGCRAYFIDMRAVPLKDLEEKVGDYVHLAEAGETVLVTDQDRILAELVPPRDREPATWAEAVRKGLIQPAETTAGVPLRVPAIPFDDLMRDLKRDREDR